MVRLKFILTSLGNRFNINRISTVAQNPLRIWPDYSRMFNLINSILRWVKQLRRMGITSCLTLALAATHAYVCVGILATRASYVDRPASAVNHLLSHHPIILIGHEGCLGKRFSTVFSRWVREAIPTPSGRSRWHVPPCYLRLARSSILLGVVEGLFVYEVSYLLCSSPFD